MNIGLCYDLRDTYLSMGYTEEETAEFDKPETIEAIEQALISLGFKVYRIGNARQLIEQLCKGKRWNLVFNICEGMYGSGREAQVPAILDLYNIPYVFSGPLVLSLCLDKAMTKRVLRDMNIPTPDFCIVRNEADSENITLPFPLFVKPVAEGTGKGISGNSVITDRKQLMETCKRLLEAYPGGIMAERFLPGREFTAGITGSGDDSVIIGTMEIISVSKYIKNAVYSYETKENYLKHVRYDLPEKEISLKCEQLALDAWKGLGCLDAGRVDIKLDENGNPGFLEVNPLAGLNPVHSDLPILAQKHGISFNMLIARIMDSALRRIFKKSHIKVIL